MASPLSRLPISFKMIGTTTLLLLFTVGLYGVTNIQDLGRVYDESQEQQLATALKGAAANAVNVTGALSEASVVQIAATAYSDLEAQVRTIRARDPRLTYVRVFDGDTPAVTSGEAPPSDLTELPSEGLVAASNAGEDAASGASMLKVLGQGGSPAFIRVEVPFEAGGVKGRVEAAWSVSSLAEQRATIANRVEEQRDRSIFNALLVGVLVVLLGGVLSIIQGVAISRPIKALTNSVERLAHGDLNERAAIRSGDEIGLLGRNFNYMAERLGVLLTETKEKATLEKEMEVARIIQESLLPPSRLIDKGWFQFQGFFKSASICGGDWWSFAELPDDRLMILIGDVTGHGVSSAMITAAAKSCCDTLRHVTEGELTVTFLLEELNKTIYEAANRKFVMTFFATIIDPHARTITFSNAGHNFPMLFRHAPGPNEPAILPLVTRGNRLGDVMQSRFVERTVPFEPGDVLVWYTDGLTEGLSSGGEEYGEKRFRRSIRATLEQPADRIMAKILSDAQAFFADFTQPEDDITLVVGKFMENRLGAAPSGDAGGSGGDSPQPAA